MSVGNIHGIGVGVRVSVGERHDRFSLPLGNVDGSSRFGIVLSLGTIILGSLESVIGNLLGGHDNGISSMVDSGVSIGGVGEVVGIVPHRFSGLPLGDVNSSLSLFIGVSFNSVGRHPGEVVEERKGVWHGSLLLMIMMMILFNRICKKWVIEVGLEEMIITNQLATMFLNLIVLESK